jgi:hypothetical protein
LRLPPDSVRRIVRVNSSRDIVVESSGLPTGPFTGPEGQDPFWTTGIFRRDLFGSGAGVDITVTPEPPETSDPDAYLLLLPIISLVQTLSQPTIS